MGDDLVTEDHLSKIVRDEAKVRYRAKRYQLGSERCREVNSGTPYHRQDLWSMMLNSTIDGKPVYRTVVIPAHLPESLGGCLARAGGEGQRERGCRSPRDDPPLRRGPRSRRIICYHWLLTLH